MSHIFSTSWRIRYSTRTLIVLVAIFGIGFSGWRWYYREAYACRAIGKMGGSISWIDGPPASPAPAYSPELHYWRVTLSDGWIGGDDGLSRLKHIALLGDVVIDAHAGITTGGLRHLHSLDSLRNLYLSGFQLTDRDMAGLKSLSGLETFSVVKSRIDVGALRHVQELPHLEVLNVTRTVIADSDLQFMNPRLISLSLFDTPITDDGMPHLAQLTKLQYLNVSGTMITDRGLAECANLRSLRTIVAGRTQITSDGVERFQQARGDASPVIVEL